MTNFQDNALPPGGAVANVDQLCAALKRITVHTREEQEQIGRQAAAVIEAALNGTRANAVSQAS